MVALTKRIAIDPDSEVDQYVAYRSLSWFMAPEGLDEIRRMVRVLGPDAAADSFEFLPDVPWQDYGVARGVVLALCRFLARE